MTRETTYELIADQEALAKGLYQAQRLNIKLSEIRYPPHLFLPLFEPSESEPSSGVGYFVLNEDAETIRAAAVAFRDAGHKGVVAKFPGVWLNRDPYYLFRYFDGKQLELKNYRQAKEWVETGFKCYVDTASQRPVRQVSGFSAQETAEITWRAAFFGELADGLGLPWDGVPPLPSWISKAISFGIPIPTTTLGQDVVTFRILPSGGSRPSIDLLNALRKASKGYTFEVRSGAGGVLLCLSCASQDRELVETQLGLHFPDSVIIPAKLQEPRSRQGLTVQSLRPKYHYCHLKSFRQSALDPYAGFLELLDRSPRDSVSCFQVVFCPLREESVQTVCQELERLADRDTLLWLQSAWCWRQPGDGWGQLSKRTLQLQHDLKNRAGALTTKLPCWLVSLRLASTESRFLEQARLNWIPQYETLDQKIDMKPLGPGSLMPLKLDPGWRVLNTDELAGLVHLPGPEVKCDRLERVSSKMKQPPPLFANAGSTLGVCEFLGKATPVRLPDEVRDRHLYVIGKTRTGKSTLLLNLAVSDIAAGKGVGVIDPHGDLVEDLLHRVPEDRIRDVVYFDAADKERPIALNVLNAANDEEIALLADDLVVTFRRISEAWGERMESILRFTFHTLLRVHGTTLFDVQHILTNRDVRDRFLAQIHYPPVIQFWREQFLSLPKDAVQPILSRMSKFVLSPTLTAILGQPQSRLNFSEVLQTKKILLVNLSQGKIGDENAKLLGSLTVSQIQMAAMRRARTSREGRHPFHLYVDEFQNFTTSAFDKILSEAGKYRLCLTLAHQYVSQIDDRLRNAILGNVGTVVMLPVWPQDAHCLRNELGTYDLDDLADLSAQEHEALCRPPTRARDTFKFRTLPPSPKPPRDFSKEIIEHSRDSYGGKADGAPWSTTPPEERPGPESTSSSPEPPAEKSEAASPSTQEIPKDAEPEPVTQQREPRRPAPQDAPSSPPSKGRGGEHHKYLQQLIQQWAERHGYKVTIEKPILNGLGWVDVALEKGGRSIACEISVTTGAEHEVANLQKCLAAGFEEVILISSAKGLFAAVKQAAAAALSAAQYRRIRFFTPEEAFSFIESLETERARAGPVPNPNELLTAKEVAELLRIDVKTVYSYVQRGLLPYVKIQSNVRFVKSEILKWMQEHQFKPGGRGPRQ